VKSNKPTTYVLLLLSIGIWCTVAYRIYVAFKDDEPSVVQPVTKPLKRMEKDTVALLLNYKDPFLGEDPPPKEKVKKQQTKAIPAKRPVVAAPSPPPVEIIPDFQYKGVIRLGKNAQAIVNRKGENIVLKPKEKIGEFLVTEITDEKLIVTRKGKKYDLPRL